MALEILDENEKCYPLRKWGPEYRTKHEYWTWYYARDKQKNATREAEFTSHEPSSLTQFPAVNMHKRGW